MEFRKITSSDVTPFHDIMTAYYREGEDKDTPQEEVDAFIAYLFQLLMDGSISGCLVYESQEPAGVILWMKDVQGSSFSQMPGYGTILEISVLQPIEKRASESKWSRMPSSRCCLKMYWAFICAHMALHKGFGWNAGIWIPGNQPQTAFLYL